MAEERIDLFEGLHNAVESAAPDLLRELLQAMVVTLMGAEVDALCGAGYGERSPERVNARNAIGRGRGTRGSARSTWRSRSCARGRTFRSGCWSRAGGRSGPSWRW